MGSRDLVGVDGTSRLCYVLDGVQSSLEIGTLEMSPLSWPVSATIVNRCERHFSRMPLEVRRCGAGRDPTPQRS